MAGSAIKKGYLTNYLKSIAQQYGTRYGINEILGPMTNWADKGIRVYVGKRLAEVIEGPVSDYMSGDSVPATTEQSITKIKRAGYSFDSRVHRINFACGNRPSKKIIQTGKINGTTKRVLSDTTKGTYAQREHFSVQTGFNQKLQFNFKNQFDTVTNLVMWDQLIPDAFTTAAEAYKQSVYAHVHHFDTEVTVTNINKYLPCYLKIILFRLDADGLIAPQDILGECCNASLTSQSSKGMPYVSQLSTYVSNSAGNNVIVDPTTNGVLSAPYWKDKCEVVKTFVKKLAPQDILNFKYTHYCGSGIRVDALASLYFEEPVTDFTQVLPMGYSIMYELWGPQVEAVRADGEQIRFIGSGPAAATFEFKRSYTASRPDKSTTFLSATGGGWVNFPTAISVYTEDIAPAATTDKIVNYSAGNIVAGTGTSLEINIPVITDNAVNYEGIS